MGTIINVEKVSLEMSSKLGDRLNKSKEEVAVLKYGMFVILHTSIIMIVSLIIGFITNSVKEILIISICSAMLKRYSGGVHASSPMRCMIVGVSMSTILTLIVKMCVAKLNSINFLLVLVAGILVCYFVLYKRAPIGSKQKPLKKESKRKLLRKKSFNVMNLYSIAIFSLYVIYINNDSSYIKSICISILFGALIQIFALSKIGEKVIMDTDKILDKLHHS